MFGLGTAPAMFGVAWASGRGGTFLTARRRRALGWLLVLFGAWTAATPLMRMAGLHDHPGEPTVPGEHSPPAHLHHDARLAPRG
jgi:sulfite exporter TauE/SafE